MRITFFGTRGYIEEKSRRHKRHTLTCLEHDDIKIFVDCGLDWLTEWHRHKPDAIILTHAHPDHSFGLAHGADCPVYASKESLDYIKDFPLDDKHTMIPRSIYKIGPFFIEPFFVVHSIRCPAVGFRIRVDEITIFIAHDIISIPEQDDALTGVVAYIGDGSSLYRPLVRRQNNQLVGHTTIRAQIGWCEKFAIRDAIFTHCGSEIVAADGRVMSRKVRELGKERGVFARIAYDGLSIDL